MSIFIRSALAATITLMAVTNNANAQSKPVKLLPDSNYFSKLSTLPYQAPDFKKIKNSHYRQALEAGIKQKLNQIEAIANSLSPATFLNTVVALEKAGQLYDRVNNAFNLVSGANTNPELQQLQEDIAPKQAALTDAIYLNTKLFKRFEVVYNNRFNAPPLDKESKRLVEYYYQQFMLAGANLSEESKNELKKLNEEEAGLSAKFSNQLLNATKAGGLVLHEQHDLNGLDEADINKYSLGNGKWLIPLQNTTQQPALQSLQDRDSRQKLFEASINRAQRSDSNDTRQTIVQIASIRAKKAKLLGFDSYAEWKLKDQMAKTPATVDSFFAKLAAAVTAKAKQEASDLQDFINSSNAGIKLEAHDWSFYAEQYRKGKYNIDANELKYYFQLPKVLEKGVFYAANQLYGLTFKERKDIPVYHEDVKVYEVYDKDAKPFALFYCDYYKRDNKNGGAWMSNLVGQSTLLGTKPVIYNVCNFSKPLPGEPALLSFEDVTTMFHEFGHALHGLFASQQYPTLSGTNVARDYVEFPSQFNEHWALEPKVLKNYAVHFKSNEPIPQSLIDVIKTSSSFNKGYKLTEAIAASALDLQWHKLKADTSIANVDTFEKKALQAAGLLLKQIPPRYRSSYFLHIWSNGYAAGYYAYQWTKMLEEDAYSWFEENGGMTRSNGQRFRDMILSKGNTEDYNTMFKNFRGRDADIKAMQRSIGVPTK